MQQDLMYLLSSFPNAKTMAQCHNQEIDPDTTHWPYSDHLSFTCSQLFVLMCLFLCTKIICIFFPLSFQPEGHQTSFVFLLLEVADRDFSHRNQSPPCSVLFPMIAWKCGPRKQMMVFLSFISKYVKKAGFSLIFCSISTLSPPSTYFLSVCF